MKHGLRSESKAGKNHRENSIGQVKKPERLWRKQGKFGVRITCYQSSLCHYWLYDLTKYLISPSLSNLIWKMGINLAGKVVMRIKLNNVCKTSGLGIY